MTLLSQAVHAEIDPTVMSNTIDVLTAIHAIADVVTTSPKPNANGLSPTAEQRAVIIDEIARGAGGDNVAIKQMIVDAQSPIQSVLESASCVQSNRMVPAVRPQLIRNSDFMNQTSLTNTSTNVSVVNSCADAVRVDQWQMPTPEVLEFTAMFRPVQSDQVNTWKFKIKRQLGGTWALESKEDITSSN